MITDLKNDCKPEMRAMRVALLAAVVKMILRLARNVGTPFYALGIVGPLAMAVEVAGTPKKTVALANIRAAGVS